jgi:hypothetical protein
LDYNHGHDRSGDAGNAGNEVCGFHKTPFKLRPQSATQ